MRISPAKYALVVFSVVALSGCQFGESKYSPSATLSKLNPFSSSRDKSDYPVRPSALANATPATASDAGFATVNSSETTPRAAATSPASASPNSPYSYPTASNGSLAGSRATGSPATTPQAGSYGSPAAQVAAGPSSTPPGGSRYSWNTSTGSPDSPAAASYGSTDGNYREASLSGAYGQAAKTAPRYSVPSGRYGSDFSAGANPASPPSQAARVVDPYASVRDHNSQYTNGSQGLGASSYAAPKASYAPPTDSRYADLSRPADRYGATPPAAGASLARPSDPAGCCPSGACSSSPDRYARADATSSGTYNGYRNGQPADSQINTNWNPGGPTDNMPGRTDYQPGNTGYNPPGVSPYRSPAASYAPPSTTGNSTSPFLPGSTKLYEPRQASSPEPPQASPSTYPPTTDSRVVPAGHTYQPGPTQSYLR
jgi:hypothetical protein